MVHIRALCHARPSTYPLRGYPHLPGAVSMGSFGVVVSPKTGCAREAVESENVCTAVDRARGRAAAAPML